MVVMYYTLEDVPTSNTKSSHQDCLVVGLVRLSVQLYQFYTEYRVNSDKAKHSQDKTCQQLRHLAQIWSLRRPNVLNSVRLLNHCHNFDKRSNSTNTTASSDFPLYHDCPSTLRAISLRKLFVIFAHLKRGQA